MMTDLKKLMSIYGVMKSGHFLLAKGDHSEYYIQKDVIITIPEVYQEVAQQLRVAIAKVYNSIGTESRNKKNLVITSPAVAGIPFGNLVAYLEEVPFVYPEKGGWVGIPEAQVFRRGFPEVIMGKHLIIIEDVITTGSSVMDVVRAAGSHVQTISVISIWNRMGWDSEVMLMNTSLIPDNVKSWRPDECPLCKENMTLIDPKTDLPAKK